MNELVLSLFPGIGLLDMAFEEEGFCVVRGPDLLWGGDIRTFHPPSSKFDGIIGGPPCKGESRLAHLNGNAGHTLKDEFMRCIKEAAPRWWIMEGVRKHDAPHVVKLSPRWIGEKQSRRRYFHSNLNLSPFIHVALFEPADFKYAVLAVHGGGVGSIQRRMAKYSLDEACQLQGLNPEFSKQLPFTRDWKYEVIGNGVPLPMGRAIAKAVRRALEATS